MFRCLILFMMISSLSACASIDRGSFGEFKRSLNTKNYGYMVLEDPTKTAATSMVEAFEVKSGDCSSSGGWSDCKSDRERSELKEVDRTTQSGDEYWYGWHIFFPNDYTNIYPSKTALGQFHQNKSHPVWMFQNSSGGYHLDDQVRGSTRNYHKLIDESELRGKWHTIEVQVRWAKADDGYFRVWVDGVQKVDYKGQTMHAKNVYFKYGVYRSFMSRYKNQKNVELVPAQKVYFANVKRGTTREDLLAK